MELSACSEIERWLETRICDFFRKRKISGNMEVVAELREMHLRPVL